MQIIIQPSETDAATIVSRIIAKELRANPKLILGLATGRTMESVYQILASMHEREQLNFSHCRTYNLDEYVGLQQDDINSYRYYMNQHLFRHVNIDLRNTHLPHGSAQDLDAECARYEESIKNAGGIDLQLLGIGQNGHIGFNEPLSPIMSRTRVQTLSPATINQNSPMFDTPDKMPPLAITMGIKTILESKGLLLLATGSGKADIISMAVEGPITSMIPASSLQFHPRCTIVLDETAASKLQGVDYYRRAFERDPAWTEYR